MRKIILILLLVSIIIGCEETAFVADRESPEMVLVEAGTYFMGDWLDPYILDSTMSRAIMGDDTLLSKDAGFNTKDLTRNKDMGADFTFDARPVHYVKVDSFYIGKYEVTFEEYDRFCYEVLGTLPLDGFKGDDEYPAVTWGRGNMPVINVDWVSACKYCNWLSVKEGLEECYEIMGAEVRCDFTKDGYRLPTEAEWEYAARGGHKMLYTSDSIPVGNIYSGCNDDTSSFSYFQAEGMQKYWVNLQDYAVFNLNSGWVRLGHTKGKNGKPMPVGSKMPNEIGIYDMSGNVWEWCWDWYSQEYYQICDDDKTYEEATNPKGPRSGKSMGAINVHVLRGGSYADYPVTLRTFFRMFSLKEYLIRNDYPFYTFFYDNKTGFRVCRSVIHE